MGNEHDAKNHDRTSDVRYGEHFFVACGYSCAISECSCSYGRVFTLDAVFALDEKYVDQIRLYSPLIFLENHSLYSAINGVLPVINHFGDSPQFICDNSLFFPRQFSAEKR